MIAFLFGNTTDEAMNGNGRALLPGLSHYPAITSFLVSSSVFSSPDPEGCISSYAC
jgi:hypothetical protein